MVEVSAKQKMNLDDLMDMILLVADVQDLKANAKAPASGVVIEAQLDVGRGPVATVLVQRGTLRVGDAIVQRRGLRQGQGDVRLHGCRAHQGDAVDARSGPRFQHPAGGG